MFFLKSNDLINRKLFLLLIIILTVSLCNFWIYRLFEINFFLAELVIIETFLLFLSIFLKKNESPHNKAEDKLLSCLIYGIFSILTVALIINNFNKELVSVSTNESIQIDYRRDYFANELGKIYKNKLGIFYFDRVRPFFSKLQSQLFSPLDWRLYFAPLHPMDRERYSLLFSPFFIVGLLYLLKSIKRDILVYFLLSIVINTFINMDKYEFALFFPLISLCIGLGVIILIEKVKGHALLYDEN